MIKKENMPPVVYLVHACLNITLLIYGLISIKGNVAHMWSNLEKLEASHARNMWNK